MCVGERDMQVNSSKAGFPRVHASPLLIPNNSEDEEKILLRLGEKLDCCTNDLRSMSFTSTVTESATDEAGARKKTDKELSMMSLFLLKRRDARSSCIQKGVSTQVSKDKAKYSFDNLVLSSSKGANACAVFSSEALQDLYDRVFDNDKCSDYRIITLTRLALFQTAVAKALTATRAGALTKEERRTERQGRAEGSDGKVNAARRSLEVEMKRRWDELGNPRNPDCFCSCCWLLDVGALLDREQSPKSASNDPEAHVESEDEDPKPPEGEIPPRSES